MSTIPITTAIPIVRAAVDSALAPLVRAQHSGSGAARLYWQRPISGQVPLPCVVHQSQDSGGTLAPYLDEAGWSGLWALKVLANDPDTADAWLAAIETGMASLTASGYTITAQHARPLTIPPSDNIWQSATLYRIFLYH